MGKALVTCLRIGVWILPKPIPPRLPGMEVEMGSLEQASELE